MTDISKDTIESVARAIEENSAYLLEKAAAQVMSKAAIEAYKGIEKERMSQREYRIELAYDDLENKLKVAVDALEQVKVSLELWEDVGAIMSLKTKLPIVKQALKDINLTPTTP